VQAKIFAAIFKAVLKQMAAKFLAPTFYKVIFGREFVENWGVSEENTKYIQKVEILEEEY